MHKHSVRSGILLLLAELQFQQGGMKVSLKLDRFVWPGYPTTSVQLTVRRLMKLGELHQATEAAHLTPLGLQAVHSLQPALVFRSKPWDGVWRLVEFSMSEKFNVKRNQLRLYLQELGFGMWQRSVYASPYPLADLVAEYASHLGIADAVRGWEVSMMSKSQQSAFAEVVYPAEDRVTDAKAWLQAVDGLLAIGKPQGANEAWRGLMQSWQAWMWADPLLPVELGGMPDLRVKMTDRMWDVVRG